VASHSGGSPTGVVKEHDVTELADEEILRLGEIGTAARDDLLVRALRGLATWPEGDEDFYKSKAALQAIVDAFDRAGLAKSVLAGWAAARLEEVSTHAAEAEGYAKDSLTSARMALARADYSGANYQLNKLKTEWRFTHVVRETVSWIDDQLRRIRGEKLLD